MGRLAFQIGGLAIGAAFGAPQLGLLAGTLAGGLTDPPHTNPVGKMNDLRVNGAGYGVPIPQVYGNARVDGIVIWSTDLQENLHETEVGGKGGGPIVPTYTYTVNCAVAVCRGPVQLIRRIWAEDVLIFDSSQTEPTVLNDPYGPPTVIEPANPTGGQGVTLAAGATTAQVTVYLGGENQGVDPVMSAILDPGNVGLVPAYRGICYVVFESLLLTQWGNRIPHFSFEVQQGGATVGSVVGAVLGQAGFTAGGNLDVSTATQPINGIVLRTRQPAKEHVRELLQVYQHDLVEYDWQLHAVPRGSGIVATVAATDLGARAWNAGEREPPTRLKTTRTQDWELPDRLDLHYMSTERMYDSGSQSAIRYAKTGLQNLANLEAPLVLEDTQARQLAESLLYTHWLERDSYEFNLPLSYLPIVPGSPINLPVNGVNRRCRLVSKHEGLLSELRCRAVPDDPRLLAQVVLGGVTTVEIPGLLGPGTFTFAAWSSPPVRDADMTTTGFYVVGTTNPGSDWQGATIYYSPDGGTTWINAGVLSYPAVFGTAATVLANGQYNATKPPYNDFSDQVNVLLNAPGKLNSTDDNQAKHGAANVALVGTEILSFRDANVAGAQYNLAHLYRGWRNSFMSGHTINELFVLLTLKTVVRINVDSGLVGTAVPIKVVPVGLTLSGTPATTVTIAPAVSSGIWAPVTVGPPASPDVVTDAQGNVVMVLS